MAKKILALVLAIMMIAALSVSAFADDETVPSDGSIKVTNTTPGEVYTLFKLFDLTYSGEAVAYTADNFVKEWLSEDVTAKNLFDFQATGVEGTWVVTKKDGATDKAIIDFLNSLVVKEDGHTKYEQHLASLWVDFKEGPADSDEVLFGNLTYGYYLVESSLGAAVTVDSTLKDVEVIDKNMIPKFDEEGKYILDDEGNKLKINSASIGDTLNFVLPIAATNYNGNNVIVSYTISDTLPQGITLNKDVQVYMNGDLVKNSEGMNDKYICTYLGNMFFIAMEWAKENEDGSYTPIYDANTLIEVKYSGTVNEKAVVGEANENKAQFKWVQKDNDTHEDVPSGESPISTTKTYTGSIQINKVDPDGKPLTGAKFVIEGESKNVVIINEEMYQKDDAGTYWMLKDGKYTTTDPSGQGVDKTAYDSTTQKYSKVEVVTKDTKAEPIQAEGYVDANGKIVFKGLGEGTYTITEIVSPKGFKLLKDPITVKLQLEQATGTKEPMARLFALDENDNYLDWDDGIIPIDVKNQPGSELPSTGGIGTTIFYVLGSVFVLGAVVILLTKKRA